MYLAALLTLSAEWHEWQALSADKLWQQLIAGSPARNALHHDSFNATHTGRGWRGPVKDLGDGRKEQKFLSPPILLGSGEMIQTYAPLDWVDGHVMIQGFTADIVKPRAADAPPEPAEYPDVVPSTRDESYVHHYTFNKWQLDKKKFEKMVAYSGEDWSGTDVEVIFREAGTFAG